MSEGTDDIAERRARFAKIASAGKRAGYLALLVAIVTFFAGVATDFPSWSVAVTIAGLVAACIILPVPIVIGYGVRAAAREDRERGAR